MYKSFIAGAALLFSSRFAAAQSSTACGDVATSAARFARQNPDFNFAYVPGELALACLQSVPLQQEDNAAFLDELRLYLNWQSSLAYLSNPPDGFTGERVNLNQSLTDVRSRLDSGDYNNEYDFMLDVHTSLKRAYDFHLNFIPDILNVFIFSRGNVFSDELLSLFSMSGDGSSEPALFNWFDLSEADRGASFTPSSISQINGRNANEVVEEFAANADYHDADARYNRLLSSQAGLSFGEDANEFVEGRYYPGDTTSVEYSNGTTKEYQTWARLLVNFDGIETGQDFFRAFCDQIPSLASRTKVKRDPTLVERQTAPAVTSPLGYPEPVIFHSEGVAGGYYLDDPAHQNVAVLSIPSFGPEGDNGAVEFQNLVQNFLNNATSSGKDRLIIDVRANGGGRVFLGYDLFKQLFPNEDPWGATRFRANDAFNTAGLALTEALSDFTFEEAVEDLRTQSLGGNLALAWRSIFNYQLPRDANNEPFSSWQDLFGPNEFSGDTFTSLERYDFNNIFSDDLDMDVSGFGTRSDVLRSSPPFAAENIVLLTDGTCGSTCAVFAELIKSQALVEQIVIGGRPNNGPMQAVAGTKGAQVLSYTQITSQVLGAWNILPLRTQRQLIQQQAEIVQLLNSSRPLSRAAWTRTDPPQVRARINLRDNIRQGDDSQTPLEFVYEAADCRLWYTQEMVFDPTAVWRAAADAQWNDGQGCVEGSRAASGSVTGGADLQGSNRGGGNGGGDVQGAGSALSTSSVTALLVTGLVSMLLL